MNFKNLRFVNKIVYEKSWFYSSLDTKIYLIFATICLLLFVYSILQIKFVDVDVEDFLGMLSHLTLAYWIGYVLIVFFSIKLYFDNKLKKDIIYIIYLIIIGLFLFGVPIFAEENARFPWSYYPAGEVKTVLNTKYIDTISKHPLMTYHTWPSLHLISATILYLTDIKIENLLKYMPLFWVFSVILLTFVTGKRLRLSSNQSFFASFLILTSFWLPHYYYGPPAFAYLLYLILFMFIIAFNKIEPDVSSAKVDQEKKITILRQKINTTILISLTFTSLVITHILTAIAIISSFTLSSSFIRTLHKKRNKFIIFFLLIFISWYFYLSPTMFETGITVLVQQIEKMDFFSFTKTEKYTAGTLLTRQIIHYSRLFYLGIWAMAMAFAVIFYRTGRIKVDNREQIKICFFWLLGILALFALKYGQAEIDDRIYLYSLIPMAYIATFVFNKKIIGILAILLILPHLPAHNGTESFDMVRTTELNGANFFVKNAVSNYNETYFSMWDTFINYNDPETIKLYGKYFDVTTKPDLSKVNTSDYIINSIGSHNFITYSYGFDPLDQWIKSNQDRVGLFYDNGHYQIYKNNKKD